MTKSMESSGLRSQRSERMERTRQIDFARKRIITTTYFCCFASASAQSVFRSPLQLAGIALRDMVALLLWIGSHAIFRRDAVAHLSRPGLVFACLILLLSGCDLAEIAEREDRVTGPDDVSVVPDMLVGARYRGRTGGDTYDDMTWIFDKTHFRIVAGQAGLPGDLTQALLPADVTGYRIDGRWSVDGEELTVTELAVDGKPIDQPPRTLRAMCTPVIRIQADRRQYMFRRGTAESAWRQGDIPPWPPETTMVSGKVEFDRSAQGWLSVGYRGVIREADPISDSATLEWESSDSGFGSAQTRTHAPRSCRLQLNGDQPAMVRCVGLPPGMYLFYAQWKPPDPRVLEGKIVVGFTRWRLQGRFAAKWVVVKERPLSGVALDLVAVDFGAVQVKAPVGNAYQSVFLLPWGEPKTEPPPLNADQSWEMARWAGHQVSIEEGSAVFESVPTGRYRLFLVEHDQPAKDDDTITKYKVIADTTTIVRIEMTAEVSF